jgi:hypothetical protein
VPDAFGRLALAQRRKLIHSHAKYKHVMKHTSRHFGDSCYAGFLLHCSQHPN